MGSYCKPVGGSHHVTKTPVMEPKGNAKAAHVCKKEEGPSTPVQVPDVLRAAPVMGGRGCPVTNCSSYPRAK